MNEGREEEERTWRLTSSASKALNFSVVSDKSFASSLATTRSLQKQFKQAHD